jgi:hypothetical protein
MSQPELLKKVIEALESLGIDYMITGSVASSMQGEPRSTHDIDIVVNLAASTVPQLLQAFPEPEFYLAEQAVRDALRQRSMFNLLQMAGGEKIDFWILTDEPFDQSRFARKLTEDVLGLRLKVSAPEDTILMKLRWAKLVGGSEKQFTDALRVFEVQREKLDLNYLETWSRQLGVEEALKQIVEQAEPL